MNRSQTGRILTTHVGSLPTQAVAYDSAAEMDDAIHTALDAQRAIGLGVINDGEHTKNGDWLRYIETRIGGFEPQEAGATIINKGRDREVFAQYYADMERPEFQAVKSVRMPRGRRNWLCTGPISYIGTESLQDAIAMYKRHLRPDEEAFLTSTAPASLEPYRPNQYYKSHEEYLYALGEALRVEYRAIVDAGLILQVDDAWLAALWDRIGVEMGLEEFRKYCSLRVEVLNHALRGLPQDRIRYHLCWGSWHGPHMFDLPLSDIVDVLMKVNAGAYLIEGANPRHEHEFTVWERVKLPDGKILIPGVISHATPVIEHPELVAYRIRRFADLLGVENVIAGADCGFGGRAHPQVGWAKLKALVEGAALASARKRAA
ncbi:cobalamin-independent methionine synthase II family protein [Roseiarcaceae bacterium H3SJ34-1]|uniref:cobalamin-independent methionine synthase II family protein n=1 Tax=Terripilifer ovatus TaxID=3032367 RepID=UPI003AB9555B|nr:cobalamin-independent methionine synthase II family protein [Roseiarcaceae bacterium H3SJ34-1]